MGIDKEGAVTQGPVTSDSESSEQHSSALREIGYVPDDNRESDFYTRNGLNLRSFGRREYLGEHDYTPETNIPR